MKFWVKLVYGWNKLPKTPLPLRNPGYAPDLHYGSVNATKASPHAKFYNLSLGTTIGKLELRGLKPLS